MAQTKLLAIATIILGTEGSTRAVIPIWIIKHSNNTNNLIENFYGSSDLIYWVMSVTNVTVPKVVPNWLKLVKSWISSILF